MIELNDTHTQLQTTHGFYNYFITPDYIYSYFEELFKKELLANDINWMAIAAPSEPITCKAKARSRMIEQPATIYPQEDGSVKVVFDEPQRAITPGQAVVFYQDDLVLGGGTILEAL